MNFDTLRQELETAFANGWGDTTPVVYENTGNVPPDNFVPWIRVSIIPRASRNIVFGSDPCLVGFFAVQVFVPLDTGVGEGYRLVDSICSIMQNKDISGILTYAADVKNVGEGIRRIKDVEMGYHQLNVFIPYEAQT